MAEDDMIIDLNTVPTLQRAIEKELEHTFGCSWLAIELHKGIVVTKQRDGFKVSTVRFVIEFDPFTEEIRTLLPCWEDILFDL